MIHALDDEYIRRTAAWVRANESQLAGIRTPRSNVLNPLSWTASPLKPATLTLTKHQLSYILTRMEGVGISVGSLDIPLENPRPSQLLPKDTSDTYSISSFVSNFSLSPSSWWSAPKTIEAELKYLYSAFTKLPALSITNPPSRVLESNALPLDAFKNLQTLSLQDIDPRSILGWDRLADSLRNLTISRSGMEDVSDLIIDAVVDDVERRQKGDMTPITRKSILHRPAQARSRPPSWQNSLRRTSAIQEEDETTPRTSTLLPSPISPEPSAPKLSPSKWGKLRYLCLADNGLTFFSSTVVPYLTSLISLDLSNNLLVSVPPGLGELHRLVSLNLAGNMIDSVLGIYATLGQVHSLNLSSNRLDSLCGLERLGGLQRIDLRKNQLEESAEVGRMATLPGIAEVWVSGNPMTSREEDWRVQCFSFFVKEGKEIRLDDTVPGFMERGRIDAIAGTPKLEPVTVVASPPPLSTPRPPSISHSRSASLAGVLQSSDLHPATPNQQSPTPSTSASPLIPSHPASPSGPIAHPKPRKRKQPRIVDLGDDDHPGAMSSGERSPASYNALLSVSPSKSHVILSSSPEKGSAELPDTVVPLGVSTEGSDVIRSHARSASSSDAIPSPRANTSGTSGDERHSPLDTVAELPSPPLNGYPNARSLRSATIAVSASVGRNAGRTGTKSNRRRARVSASVFEPSANHFGASDPPSSSESSSPRKPSILGGGAPLAELDFASEADAFRAQVEAIRKDVGDGWLKVLTQQSNGLATTPGVGGKA
ncbi:hypothetical protein FRB96_008823 [Tulasnella sp. 330]|nr:hypothetical protein FRB96_008823 [Tulasnella sp. 330]KAG8882298.1 hypothetical protein FRB97_008406 [Tulasnella sp. 331]KAG8888264.1 hypothetical protein FRB98_008098 [Tulasnella sp. 332]